MTRRGHTPPSPAAARADAPAAPSAVAVPSPVALPPVAAFPPATSAPPAPGRDPAPPVQDSAAFGVPECTVTGPRAPLHPQRVWPD